MDNPFYTLGKGLGFRNKKTQIKPADPVFMPELLADLPKTKPFAEMTCQEKKIAVAKDVLLQLEAHKLRMTRGTYCSGVKKGHVDKDKLPMKDYADAMSEACNVCAMGAVFLSQVRLSENKNLAVGWYDSSSHMTSFGLDGHQIIGKMQGTFNGSELRQMEYYFERINTSVPAAEMMRRIMSSIVKNEGLVPDPFYKHDLLS